MNYQKEINGKIVLYTWVGMPVEAIMLWPLGGHHISIKQYDNSVRVNAKLAWIIWDYQKARGGKKTFKNYFDWISSPGFCFLSSTPYPIQTIVGSVFLDALRDMPEGGCLKTVLDRFKKFFRYQAPICPYGS